MKISDLFKVTKKIKAQTEGSRDILNTTITNLTRTEKEINKNNYLTYEAQVNETYKMYNGKTDYGGDILRSLIDIRSAFIAGEGISLTAIKNKSKVQKFLDKFSDDNELSGSRFYKMVQTGEMEGRNLLLLKNDKAKNKIKVRSFSWYVNKYNVEVKKEDYDEIKSIIYQENKQQKNIALDKSVYVKLGGCENNVDETPSKVGVVLTQIENMDRALYDLRSNNHLYAKLTPYWETDSSESAKKINNAINNAEWEMGKGYAGRAKFSIVGPPTGALDNIQGEIFLLIKIISTATGIPVHWLSFPEMLSNRATAENLMEVIAAQTRKERQVWEESIKELIQKAMVMSIESGYEWGINEPDSFQVKIPLVSLSMLKALVETWLPLQQSDVISMATMRNQVFGIDPSKEEKIIANEKEENMKRSPLAFNNMKTPNDIGENKEEGEQDDISGNVGQGK